MDTCAGSFKSLGDIDDEITHLFKFIDYIHVIDTRPVVLAG